MVGPAAPEAGGTSCRAPRELRMTSAKNLNAQLVSEFLNSAVPFGVVLTCFYQ